MSRLSSTLVGPDANNHAAAFSSAWAISTLAITRLLLSLQQRYHPDSDNPDENLPMPPEVIAQLQLVTTGMPNGILARGPSPNGGEDPKLAKLRNLRGERAPSRTGTYIIGPGLRKSLSVRDRKSAYLQPTHTRGTSMAGVYSKDGTTDGQAFPESWKYMPTPPSSAGWRGLLGKTRGAFAGVASLPSRIFASSTSQSRGAETMQDPHLGGGVVPYRLSNVIPMEERNQNANRPESVYFMDDAGMIRKSAYPMSPSRHHTPIPRPTSVPPVPPMPTIPTRTTTGRSLSPSGMSGPALSIASHAQSELLRSTSNTYPSDTSPPSAYPYPYPSPQPTSNPLIQPPSLGYNYQHASHEDPPRAVNDPFYSYYRQAQAGSFSDAAGEGRMGLMDRWRSRMSKPLPPTPATARSSFQGPPPRSPALLD